MGQYFELINIDRGQSKHLGKFGELYLYVSKVAMYLCDNDPQYSWAGDRLILIGDYADDFPQGVMTDFESKFEPRYGWSRDTGFPAPRMGKTYSETSVLRNLCSREYIRADLFPGTNDHPGLGEALMPRILWTSDRSLAIRAEIDIRGPWAGGRMDIVELSVVENDLVWKDITEVAFFDFYDMWSSDLSGPDNCTCTLCTKYRDERESFRENRLAERRREHDKPPVRRAQAAAIAEPVFSDAGYKERVPVVRADFSPVEKLPGEIQASIFSNMSTKDLEACAVTSKALSREATRRLYASVRLVKAGQTVVLLETLKTHPEYARYIRDLRLVTMAHWESLQAAHDILKQLPRLTSLEFGPCWFSYGDLPYCEYPFELQTLKSGLRHDHCFERFRRSQPKAKRA